MTKQQAKQIAEQLAIETNQRLNIVDVADSLDGDQTEYIAKQYLKELNRLNGNI